jgi:hypothetical protein
MYPKSSKVGTPRVPHQDDIQELIDAAIMINRTKTFQTSSEEISAAVAALVNSAPGTLDTLGELAAALEAGDTAATALFNSVATKTTLAAATAAASALIASQHTSDNSTYGTLLTPVETIAYNGDGTVASQTIGGVATTYTYNTDATVATETRAGVTRTYTYTGANLTAVA